jgi:hypothetical protein
VMSTPPTTRSHGDDHHPPPVAERPYNAARAAPGYANVTGLVSTFALAAVVLVFLIAATASTTPSPSENADMGLATLLFAVGFLGCLLSAFAFAALAGGPQERRAHEFDAHCFRRRCLPCSTLVVLL